VVHAEISNPEKIESLGVGGSVAVMVAQVLAILPNY